MISYQCNSIPNKVCIHHKQPLHQRRNYTSAGAGSLGYIQQLLYGLLVCGVIVFVLLPVPCHGGRRKHRHGTRHVGKCRYILRRRQCPENKANLTGLITGNWF